MNDVFITSFTILFAIAMYNYEDILTISLLCIRVPIRGNFLRRHTIIGLFVVFLG